MKKHTSIFVLGLIGSILGLVGSLTWFATGTGFWAGFYDGLMGYDYSGSLSDNAIGFGVFFAFVQSAITIAAFILTLIKSIPSKLEKSLHNSGIWLLTLGIITLVINISLIVPSILVIIAGSLALSRSNQLLKTTETVVETPVTEVTTETKAE